MIIYTNEMLQEYLENDWILKLLLDEEKVEDKGVRTHQWLKDMENKRLVFSHVYGDLLCNKKQEDDTKKVVLDVGGGYSAITRRLIANHEYHLLDFIAHGGQDTIHYVEQEYQKRFWINGDWMDYDIASSPCDIIIANDIFPDVDQRLELFIEKYLPYCKEMRLVLTFYNEPKYYRTKRVDDAEVLTFLSWDGEITSIKLKKYIDRLVDTDRDDLDILKDIKDSIYWNGRQVAYVTFRGEGRD